MLYMRLRSNLKAGRPYRIARYVCEWMCACERKVKPGIPSLTLDAALTRAILWYLSPLDVSLLCIKLYKAVLCTFQMALLYVSSVKSGSEKVWKSVSICGSWRQEYIGTLWPAVMTGFVFVNPADNVFKYSNVIHYTNQNVTINCRNVLTKSKLSSMAIATMRTFIIRVIRLLFRASGASTFQHITCEDEGVLKQDKRWNEKRLRVKLHDDIIVLHMPH